MLHLFKTKPKAQAYYETVWSKQHNRGRRLFGATASCVCAAPSSCWSGKSAQAVTVELDSASHGRKFLSTNTDGTALSLWMTSTGNSEKWEITDNGSYATLSVVTTEPPPARIWMSTNADGTSVSSWTSSTGGNQKWVVENRGTYVNIRAHSSAEPQSRIWLGANSDGTNVDLWSGYTGSNYNWKITCI